MAVERDLGVGNDARDVDTFVRAGLREFRKRRDVDAPLGEHVPREARHGVALTRVGPIGTEGDVALVRLLAVDFDIDEIAARQQAVAGGEHRQVRPALSAAELQEGRIEVELLLCVYAERVRKKRDCQSDVA